MLLPFNIEVSNNPDFPLKKTLLSLIPKIVEPVLPAKALTSLIKGETFGNCSLMFSCAATACSSVRSELGGTE